MQQLGSAVVSAVRAGSDNFQDALDGKYRFGMSL